MKCHSNDWYKAFALHRLIYGGHMQIAIVGGEVIWSWNQECQQRLAKLKNQEN